MLCDWAETQVVQDIFNKIALQRKVEDFLSDLVAGAL